MKQTEEQNRINYLIRESSVRLVGENVENGVFDTRTALKLAQDMELDLVEISKGVIPVCKIIDYRKFLYDKKKKDKEQKKKQKLNQSEVK